MTAPLGWWKCNGGTFDINAYPALHAHLQTIPNYNYGVLPNFQGLYPGGAGISNSNQLDTNGPQTNHFYSQRTAKPYGGAPRSSASIPDGTTREFAKSGGTNAYSNGAAKVTIDEGWDNVTRPPTLSVHFIIKD